MIHHIANNHPNRMIKTIFNRVGNPHSDLSSFEIAGNQADSPSDQQTVVYDHKP
jgi:hypothetical protein